MKTESKQDNSLLKRKHLRLPEYDYAQEGAYFVTVCTKGKACLFGNIFDGKMMLNDAGKMVEECWNAIPVRYPGIETDEFVVMPNHVHGIIVITDSTVGAPPVAARTLLAHNEIDRKAYRYGNTGRHRGLPLPIIKRYRYRMLCIGSNP